MNWVILLARNNLHLTRKAARTILAQDIGDVHLLIIDNDSEDGTSAWLQSMIGFHIHTPRISVAAAWNVGLRFVFHGTSAQYCLVVNNDIELRPDTYKHLVRDGGGFVTAVGTRDPEKIKPVAGPANFDTEQWQYPDPDPDHKRPHPDFSCYMIRRETWDTVGEFDENFKIAFGEDWDYHCRLHKAGIRAECLDLPFLHHGSMTIKNADVTEQRRIALQADKNREYFRKKWGFAGGSPEYYRFFESSPPPELNVREVSTNG